MNVAKGVEGASTFFTDVWSRALGPPSCEKKASLCLLEPFYISPKFPSFFQTKKSSGKASLASPAKQVLCSSLGGYMEMVTCRMWLP